MRLFLAEQVRDFDRIAIEEMKVPGVVLMENAGRNATEILVRHLPPPTQSGPIAIFAGPGNNGGDGYVMARHLLNQGYTVWTFLCTTPQKIRGDARINLNILKQMTEDIYPCETESHWEPWKEKISRSEAIVDALLGTGLRSDVTGWYLSIIQNINSMKHPLKVAVDLPSGLDPNSGNPRPVCVTSDLTTTFAAAKVGLTMPNAVPHVGKLEVVDIGMPSAILHNTKEVAQLQQNSDLKSLWPLRPFNSHKGTFGHLFVLAGSPGKAGAALLTCMASLRSGVGLCTWANTTDVVQSMQSNILEVMTASLSTLNNLNSEQHFSSEELQQVIEQTLEHAAGKSAWVIGPGLGQSPFRSEWLKALLLRTKAPVILDADGLNLLANNLDVLKQRTAPTVVTPHPGEMSRLTGKSSKEVQLNRLSISQEWAREYNVTLVLKGARTIIVGADGSCWINPTGHNGLATAGSGDVLSGMVGALLARGMDASLAARLAVFLHGKSADELREKKGQSGLIAGDIVEQLPQTIAAWENTP